MEGVVAVTACEINSSNGSENANSIINSEVAAISKCVEAVAAVKDIKIGVEKDLPSNKEDGCNIDGVQETISNPKDLQDCDRASNKEEDEYCNPMVSDSEEEDAAEDIVLRGDRIGNTAYSERHVLKLLMKLVQELPRYTVQGIPDDSEDKENIKLETDFEEEMSLLWDMSAEPDVMSYLVDNDIFTIIRDTMELSKSMRLTEVALGIMANILSQKTIVEDFHVYDAKLKLVAKVIHQLSKVSNVAVLIQIFAVLKRIVWFIKNVKIVDEWLALFLNDDFFQYANFIMASSTNLLLLGDVIITLYSLLETLCTDSAETEHKEGEDGKTSMEKNAEEIGTKYSCRENFRPFCQTTFLSSICEGLNELLKNPKPKASRHVAEFTGGQPDNEFEVDTPMPDDHVQTAILNGLSALTYLKKISWAQNVMIEHKEEILKFVIRFHQKFSLCSDNHENPNSVEYFVLSLSLLEFCHKHFTTLYEEAVSVPIATAYQLILAEQQNNETNKRFLIRMKSGLDFDSVTYIALEMHNYVSTVTQEFGEDYVSKLRKQDNCKKFFSLLDERVAKVCDAND